MAKVLLSDIATRCGTSVSTVSRVLSGDTSRKTSEATRALIISTARELGWFQNRQETIKKAKPLSVAVLFLSDHESLLSPFFNEVIEGIKEAAASSTSYEIELRILNHYDLDFFSTFEESHTDIAILLGRMQSEILERIRATNAGLIYAGLNPIGGMDAVICDARAGTVMAVDHLYDLGHRKIAFIGPCRQSGVENEFRFEGYMEGLEKHSIAYESSLVYDCYLTSQDGYRCARSLVANASPTAIVCANDNLAIGVMKGLADAGISVPGDISVIGFDNIEASAFLNPPLTTIDVPKRDFGRFALSLAIERMESGRDYDVSLSLPFRIIKRNSTKGIPNG